MKKTALLFALLISGAIYSQDISGKWFGILKIQNNELAVIFDITIKDSLIRATMESPDQGVKDIPVEFISYENSILKISDSRIMMNYTGVNTGEVIMGTFRQNNLSFPLNLSKRAPKGYGRPQEPKGPFTYKQEEIIFINKKDSITLSGTLTTPEKDSLKTVVILITGSGPQNRNQEIAGHKPFLVLSDYLTRNGISVLRYDDRGVGKSGGKFQSATTVDFAEDVYWAIEYLKSRGEYKHIGLIGHSEGGIIAPMVASRGDDLASFIVLMAGTGVKGCEILLDQQRLISVAGGMKEEDVESLSSVNKKIFSLIESNQSDIKQLREDIRSTLREETKGELSEAQISQQIMNITSPWMLYFIKYDPSEALKRVKCPVLALNGTKDLQVPYKRNLEAIHKALTGEERSENRVVISNNTLVTTIELENLNHLFQFSQTGHPNEYSKIEETINPQVLTQITSWIKSIVKR